MVKHRKLLPEHTEEPHLHDPAVQSLSEKIRVQTRQDPDDTVQLRSRYAEVTITLKNSQQLHSKTTAPKWNKENPATDQEIITKYRELVADYLPNQQRDELELKTMNLETVPDVSEIVRLTVPDH